MAYRIDLVSVTGSDLILVGEMKEFLKVTHKVEDQLITDLINQVTSDIEAYTGASYREAQWKLYCSRWNYGCIPINRFPVSTIDSVEYYDIDNSLQTLSSASYFLSKGNPDYFMKARDVSLPAVYNRHDAIQITFTTSAVNTSQAKLRIMQAVSYMYENRNNHAAVPIDRIMGSLTAGLRMYNHVI